MSDGEIDYSKYTLCDLQEALATIDRDRYPKNYSNLITAYEAATAGHTETTETAPSRLDRLGTSASALASWFQRGIAALAGTYMLWWAYALFMNNEACPTKRKLVGRIAGELCERFGHTAGASALACFGILLLAYAANVWPRLGR